MNKSREFIRTSSRIINKLCCRIERVLALPLCLPFIFLGWLGILTNRYAEVSLVVSRIPFRLGEYTRYFYYKATLEKVGKDVVFRYGSFCQYRKTYIGDRVLIGYFNALGEVSIGDDVLIGCFVNFTSGLHHHSFADPTKKINEQPAKGRRMISIGSDVWIGNNCVICNDVGNRCVIGVGSVVIKKVEDHSVYAGNPARLIRNIDCVVHPKAGR